MTNIWNLIVYILNLPLVPVGRTTVTLAMLIYIVLLFSVLIAFSRSLRRRLSDLLLRRSNLDPGMQSAFAMISQYSFIGLGTIIILNTAGIEMSALTVVAGALGLGLSLGLQTIAKSVAGGIMILMERPVKLGDRVQIGNTTGDITRIALRSTTIRTDDNMDVIVPNSEFMDQKIINWTHSSNHVTVALPFTIAMENDLSKVLELAKNTAASNNRVLTDPPPEVLLDSFEEGKLKFLLRIAICEYANHARLKSELNIDLCKTFSQAAIKLEP